MAVRFSEEARRVCESANAEAGRFGSEYVGTEHFLLALMREGASVAVQVLDQLGVTAESVRRETEELLGIEPRTGGDPTRRLPHTDRAKRVIEQAAAETERLGHELVRPEHLLVGMLREGHGVAANVLKNLGAGLSRVRLAIPQEIERRSRIAKWLAWNEGTAAAIARAITEERNWDGLPVLADALEEAGCDDREILDHLRQMEPHPCRKGFPSGCWVLNGFPAAEAVVERADEPPPPRRRWWRFWK